MIVTNLNKFKRSKRRRATLAVILACLSLLGGRGSCQKQTCNMNLEGLVVKCSTDKVDKPNIELNCKTTNNPTDEMASYNGSEGVEAGSCGALVVDRASRKGGCGVSTVKVIFDTLTLPGPFFDKTICGASGTHPNFRLHYENVHFDVNGKDRIKSFTRKLDGVSFSRLLITNKREMETMTDLMGRLISRTNQFTLEHVHVSRKVPRDFIRVQPGGFLTMEGCHWDGLEPLSFVMQDPIAFTLSNVVFSSPPPASAFAIYFLKDPPRLFSMLVYNSLDDQAVTNSWLQIITAEQSAKVGFDATFLNNTLGPIMPIGGFGALLSKLHQDPLISPKKFSYDRLDCCSEINRWIYSNLTNTTELNLKAPCVDLASTNYSSLGARDLIGKPLEELATICQFAIPTKDQGLTALAITLISLLVLLLFTVGGCCFYAMVLLPRLRRRRKPIVVSSAHGRALSSRVSDAPVTHASSGSHASKLRLFSNTPSGLSKQPSKSTHAPKSSIVQHKSGALGSKISGASKTSMTSSTSSSARKRLAKGSIKGSKSATSATSVPSVVPSVMPSKMISSAPHSSHTRLEKGSHSSRPR